MAEKGKITDGVSPEAERVLPKHLPEIDPRVAQEVVMTTGFFHVPLLESLLAGIDNAQQHFVRRKNRRSQHHAGTRANTRPGARPGSPS